jgi:hypothetical protein
MAGGSILTKRILSAMNFPSGDRKTHCEIATTVRAWFRKVSRGWRRGETHGQTGCAQWSACPRPGSELGSAVRNRISEMREGVWHRNPEMTLGERRKQPHERDLWRGIAFRSPEMRWKCDSERVAAPPPMARPLFVSEILPNRPADQFCECWEESCSRKRKTSRPVPYANCV